MNTLLTIKQQHDHKHNGLALIHHWSSNGMGNSKVVTANNPEMVLGKAGGCGYDRRGSAIANALEVLFPDEIAALAKRHCNSPYGSRACGIKSSDRLYGLFLNDDGTACIDGGCGLSAVELIMNAIGFDLNQVSSVQKDANRGADTFIILPLSKHLRAWLKGV